MTVGRGGKTAAKLAAGTLIVLLALMGLKLLKSRDAEGALAVKWEGLVNDRNFRDAGASLNACLGRHAFFEDVVYRAAVWFSGWSCASVGDPATLYSLNFDPEGGARFFCEGDDGTPRVGRHFQRTKELNDLEFIATWDDPESREVTCAFLDAIFQDLVAERRVLIHCDAGRDRTGTVTAILAALAAEARGELDQRMIDAIECDYRKSKSLSADKHGRQAAFLGELQRRGGVAAFLEASCGIPRETLDAAGKRFAP